MSRVVTDRIEMSPGNFWGVVGYNTAKIAGTCEGLSRLMDGPLADAIFGKMPLNEALVDLGQAGGEGVVFEVKDDPSLVVKIPHGEDSLSPCPLKIASVARYGGVCVQKALEHATTDIGITTPVYHAMFRIDGVEGVLMSRARGMSLAGALEQGFVDATTVGGVCTEIEVAVKDALVASGLHAEDVAAHLDLSDDDVMVSIADGEADLSTLVVLDFMNMAAPHRPKLWDNT